MLLFLATLSYGWAADVFIFDDTDSDVYWMVDEVSSAGHEVTLSSDLGFYEWEFEGTEVSCGVLSFFLKRFFLRIATFAKSV